MPTEPISQEQRDTLLASRNILLDLHKALLDRQKEHYEQQYGPLATPNEYFNLVLNHADFEWLRRMSGLIVNIDESLSRKSKADFAVAEELVREVNEIIIRDENGTDFQKKYAQAFEDYPDVTIAHIKLTRILDRA